MAEPTAGEIVRAARERAKREKITGAVNAYTRELQSRGYSTGTSRGGSTGQSTGQTISETPQQLTQQKTAKDIILEARQRGASVEQLRELSFNQSQIDQSLKRNPQVQKYLELEIEKTEASPTRIRQIEQEQKRISLSLPPGTQKGTADLVSSSGNKYSVRYELQGNEQPSTVAESLNRAFGAKGKPTQGLETLPLSAKINVKKEEGFFKGQKVTYETKQQAEQPILSPTETLRQTVTQGGVLKPQTPLSRRTSERIVAGIGGPVVSTLVDRPKEIANILVPKQFRSEPNKEAQQRRDKINDLVPAIKEANEERLRGRTKLKAVYEDVISPKAAATQIVSFGVGVVGGAYETGQFAAAAAKDVIFGRGVKGKTETIRAAFTKDALNELAVTAVQKPSETAGVLTAQGVIFGKAGKAGEKIVKTSPKLKENISILKENFKRGNNPKSETIKAKTALQIDEQAILKELSDSAKEIAKTDKFKAKSGSIETSLNSFDIIERARAKRVQVIDERLKRQQSRTPPVTNGDFLIDIEIARRQGSIKPSESFIRDTTTKTVVEKMPPAKSGEQITILKEINEKSSPKVSTTKTSNRFDRLFEEELTKKRTRPEEVILDRTSESVKKLRQKGRIPELFKEKLPAYAKIGATGIGQATGPLAALASRAQTKAKIDAIGGAAIASDTRQNTKQKQKTQQFMENIFEQATDNIGTIAGIGAAAVGIGSVGLFGGAGTIKDLSEIGGGRRKGSQIGGRSYQYSASLFGILSGKTQKRESASTGLEVRFPVSASDIKASRPKKYNKKSGLNLNFISKKVRAR